MPLEKEKPIRVRMSDTLFTAIRASLDTDTNRLVLCGAGFLAR